MSIINQWINRYILAGRGSVADSAPTNEVVVDANGAMQTLSVNSAGIVVENTEGMLLASAARTTTPPAVQLTNYNARGILVMLDVTAAPASPGAGGLTVKIRGVDPVTGKAFHINIDPTLVTTVGSHGYMIYPGASAATGATASVKQFTAAALPRTVNMAVFHADAQSYTYTLGYSLII